MNSAGTFSFVATAVLSSTLLIGCVDARGEYDEFGARVVDAGSTDLVDGQTVSQIPDIDGEWLMAVHPEGLPEDPVILFRTTFDMTLVTENTAKLDMIAQPLAAADQTPVGDPLTTTGRDIGTDAHFTAPLMGEVAGPANPVTQTAVFVNANLAAEIRSADFVCGTATGNAGSLPLDGTTWAAVRITGDELPQYVYRCDDAQQ